MNIKKELPKYKIYLRSLNKKRKDLTKEEAVICARLYYEDNIESYKNRYEDKIFTENGKEKAREASKKYYKKFPYSTKKEKCKLWRIQFYKKYPEKLRDRKMRGFLYSSLKRQNKTKDEWINEVGCSHEDFIKYIESKFEEGMSWDNWTHNGWHLDHIIPLSKGGSNHYTNIQPLWAYDNMSKHNKILS